MPVRYHKKMPGPATLTEIIQRATRSSDPAAVEELYRCAVPALRRTAARYLRDERAGHTLQPTALIHDALIEVLGCEVDKWESRDHFFAAMARQMRWILTRHARDRAALKREGSQTRMALLDEESAGGSDFEQVLVIADLLDGLEQVDERAARIVEMTFFAGMTQEETAGALGVAVATVQRDWTFARAWLYSELTGPVP
ncbi:MAG: sigma-70 family RNA polymerase sigma factor [Acidobacteria bacterium]|nr:sigma-70 family RNA polymerase sigma factor [Acidobacteriota bacterium]